MFPTYSNYNKQPVNTSIFYFNDYHDNNHRMGNLKTASDQFFKTRNPSQVDTFTLTGGDMMKGSNPNFNAMWVEFLNIIKTDASTLGNHELDQKPTGLNNTLKRANYKYVSSNIDVNPFGSLSQITRKGILVNSTVINKNGHQYGIVGLSPTDPKYRDIGNILNNNDLKVKDSSSSIAELQKEVNKLEKQGINKIILLSHFDDDQNIIPKKVSGIDVIISGHKHKIYKGLVPGKNLFFSPRLEPVAKVEGGKDGKYAGILDVSFDSSGKIINAQNNLMETKNFPPSPSIIKLKQKYGMYKGLIGELKQPVEKDVFPENPIASLITDAVRKKSGADIALLSPESVCSDLEKGFLSENDIKEVLPYKNNVVKVKMNEKNLIKMIDNFNLHQDNDSIESHPLQVSGLKYTLTAGNKLIKLSPDQKNQDKTYTVAFDEYLLKTTKGINFQVLEKYQWTQADATIEHIKNKHFHPFEIKPEGRIKIAYQPKELAG